MMSDMVFYCMFWEYFLKCIHGDGVHAGHCKASTKKYIPLYFHLHYISLKTPSGLENDLICVVDIVMPGSIYHHCQVGNFLYNKQLHIIFTLNDWIMHL